MTTNIDPRRASAWNGIERERRLDRIVRGICGGAWAATFVLTGSYAVLIGQQVIHALRLQEVGAATTETVTAAAAPLVVALGTLTLLIATLSTVSLFLRFRTATLGEIQLRLAALEAMIAARGGAATPSDGATRPSTAIPRDA
jgi:hypothetical protein